MAVGAVLLTQYGHSFRICNKVNMTNELETVTTEKETDAPRMLIYGVQGVGKSTFPYFMPKPIYLQTEDGLKHLDVAKFPIPEDLNKVHMQLDSLISGEHDYMTLVIDTLDWLERKIHKHVASKAQKENIAEIGFGKGYKAALDEWHRILEKLDVLNKQRGMAIVCLAHSKIERFQSPDLEPFDRYQPDLDDRSVGPIQEWADAVLFVNYKMYVKKIETVEGFGKKVAQGTGGKERVLYTQERPAFYAKNRLYLPPELPFSWKALAEAISAGADKKPIDFFSDEMPNWA